MEIAPIAHIFVGRMAGGMNVVIYLGRFDPKMEISIGKITLKQMNDGAAQAT